MKGPKTDDSFDLLAINEVLRGNPDAYEGIVNKYQQQLLHLAYSFLGDTQAAEDAVQEIFIKAYTSLHRFSLDRRFHPWLYSIAVNYLKNVYRKNKKNYSIQMPDSMVGADEYPMPEDLLAKKEEIQRIRTAVNRLPVKIREPFILYYLEEMKISEISEILGISMENIKSKLFRGRKIIRKYLIE
ncbi:MAG: sigma-70 family RNA polymerase sigma factor [Spirochaetales bacterium]|nr:sigma-70 family RNA polymerase sigma factor [Spirochaetales bacterium]